MSFGIGQTIVRRDLHFDGALTSALPGRVVADDARGVMTWTAQGSQRMVRTTLEGESVRKFAVQNLENVPTMLSPARWEGTSILWLTPPGAAYSVLWFFDASGAFFGWYVNLETPSRRWPGGIDMRDLALDIWAEPDRTWTWKDEDEFAERTGHPAYWSTQEATAVRAVGERVAAQIEAGASPFDGTFTRFTPDPAWTPAVLPVTWDRYLTNDLPAIARA